MEQVMLDMIPTGAKAVCHVSQYDIGRTIRFNLRSNGTVYTLAGTETIKVYIKKPDGTTAERNIANTSSTYVDWVTGEGDCDQAGKCECELVITSGTTVIGSKNFTVNIEEDPYNEQGVVTETAGPAVIATFTTNVIDLLQEVKCEINATGGNGTPDNPNPINGYSSAYITRCGKNLWELSDDTKNDGDRVTIDYINNGVKLTANDLYARASYVYNVKAGQTYTLSYYGYGTANFIQVYYNDAIAWNPQNYGRQSLTSTRTKYTKTITATSDVLFVGFYVTSTGTTGDMVIEDFMLEVGSSASDDFHAYNGQTYTIAFGQTVYGGVLDVTSGKLHVTHDVVDLGSLPWNRTTSYTNPLFYTNLNTKKSGNITMISDIYAFAGNFNNASSFSVSNDNTIGSCYNNEQIYVRNDAYTDKDAFIIAMSGKYVLFPLATPFDIDLTPVQIEALLGENNICHDANGDTEVKYLYNA